MLAFQSLPQHPSTQCSFNAPRHILGYLITPEASPEPHTPLPMRWFDYCLCFAASSGMCAQAPPAPHHQLIHYSTWHLPALSLARCTTCSLPGGCALLPHPWPMLTSAASAFEAGSTCSAGLLLLSKLLPKSQLLLLASVHPAAGPSSSEAPPSPSFLSRAATSSCFRNCTAHRKQIAMVEFRHSWLVCDAGTRQPDAAAQQLRLMMTKQCCAPRHFRDGH